MTIWKFLGALTAFALIFPIVYLFIFGPFAHGICAGWYAIFIGEDSFATCSAIPQKMGVI